MLFYCQKITRIVCLGLFIFYITEEADMYNSYNSSFYNDPAMRLTPMGQTSFPQPIQTLQTIQPSFQCFFVSAPSDISSIQLQPNVVYIGINKQSKELYTKQWTNDGLIESKTYVLSDGRKEETDLKAILSRLESIDKRLGNESNNDTAVNAAGNGRTTEQQPINVNVPTNDVGQVPATTV